MKEEDITRFIPQRPPILMVDKLISVNDDVAVTSFMVRSDNCFIDEDGLLAEAGLIEHIAQSASAVAGYKAVNAGATKPPLGYIGEIKNFCCLHRPQIGDKLSTTILMGSEIAGITIISGETRVLDEVVANTQMKIFIK